MKTTSPVLAFLAIALTACSVTQEAPVKQSARSGLLDYSRLSPGGPGQTALRYVNPDARWTSYKKIIIDPVTFWDDDNTISADSQQALCDYFYQSLRQKVGQQLEVVDRHGPGVMKLDVALTDASAATPILRSASMVIPQVRVLATLKYAGTGTYPFVGSAQVEAKLTDAQTGQLLGEWVDRQVGGGSPTTAAQWQWGDAENAINDWTTRSANKLAAWTSGTGTP